MAVCRSKNVIRLAYTISTLPSSFSTTAQGLFPGPVSNSSKSCDQQWNQASYFTAGRPVQLGISTRHLLRGVIMLSFLPGGGLGFVRKTNVSYSTVDIVIVKAPRFFPAHNFLIFLFVMRTFPLFVLTIFVTPKMVPLLDAKAFIFIHCFFPLSFTRARRARRSDAVHFCTSRST